ncbi:MAG: cyclase family protein [Methanothrix sp.]|nr:cyclase family protein [Methanothrix sp.]
MSVPLWAAPAFTGERRFGMEWLHQPENCNRISAMKLSNHTGTHLDAPAHILPDGRTLGRYPLDRFIPPAALISTGGAEVVSVQDLADMEAVPWEASFRPATTAGV